MPGPSIRTDVVDVYVFRRCAACKGDPGSVEFLQLRRSSRVKALAGTWQPVMGHVEAGESATQTALRELSEETGIRPGEPRRALLGLWQLESLNTFFLASIDAVMMSPCFAAQVGPECEPVLDETHDAFRWVARDHTDRLFMWPGQRVAIEQIVRDILPEESSVRAVLKIPL